MGELVLEEETIYCSDSESLTALMDAWFASSAHKVSR